MTEDEFGAALAAKVAVLDEQEATTTTEETPAEVEAENVAPEVEAETEPESEPTSDEPTFTSKFKSWEEAEKAYENAQQVLGRQGQELGDLRSMVEQVQQTQTRSQQPHIGQLQAALEEDPQQVAMWAVQNNQFEVLDQAVDAWYQRALEEEDHRALREVNRFERAIEMAQFQNHLSSELTPALEGVKSESEVRALALAQRELRSQYPDFDQVLESVTDDEVADLDAAAIGQLKDRDPKKALETIYRWVSAGRQAKAFTANDERKAEVLESKRQAVVASSTSSPVEGKKSGKELLKEFMLTPDEHSVHHGLTQ